MFHLKKTWSCLFGFVCLVLTVIPTFAQVDAPKPATAICLIGGHPGIPESDAQTAAMLVCDALRKQGISVSEPVYEVPASASVYRIVLRRLGEKIFARLSQENPVGTVTIERQMLLANIEEMVSAAPRLVDALVHRKPIATTVDMESVTEQEARELRKVSGESLWHLGIFGTTIPGTDIIAEPGFEFGWSYETPAYAVVAEYRFTGGEERGEEHKGNNFIFFSLSIGGRYFFNKQNISPYAGGGLSIANASYEPKRTSRSDEWSAWSDDTQTDGGLGAYGVVGIELLRLSQSRLRLELRVDRPFFKLPSQDMMPVTVGLSFSRNYVPGGCLLF